MAEQNNKGNEQDLNKLKMVRREKLADLQAAGKDPFVITKYDVQQHSIEVKDMYTALEAELLAGRQEPSVEGLDEAEKREVINEDMVFGRTLYPVTCVSVGNPHCVIPMREISKNIVCKIGDYSECAKYFPHRINTQIMKVIDKENIAIEIYERGAGYTLASGTGACAAAAVAHKLGMTNNKVIVHMPGGDLQVEVEDDGTVFMTGDVFYVAKITLSSEFTENLRSL